MDCKTYGFHQQQHAKQMTTRFFPVRLLDLIDKVLMLYIVFVSLIQSKLFQYYRKMSISSYGICLQPIVSILPY
ncbi:uncharacterized protein CYBJADRAFT_166247 [Cyberlindnera jadinii NRRL Y-1542]|uniref:Uncharacterized protein n=1 Tax=Cyberlindnera jadinii (strain ATCC 18201 / CBS 1600 / BCRC 20928 / JCM 3617 / NBRC 0987 / NRRL Y-1542) TaxID=983966 RepID=A0A1E4S7T3_CYBJN|nr:hypothetical protein CYBJADRAFT_166247 [Cyberlindnera jadinii NRRL Y-1542]ODV75523.1 hypothetical protein CYBJADRAFT_166247 [Cyberlindnera jadinii NRRL Y-1542]